MPPRQVGLEGSRQGLEHRDSLFQQDVVVRVLKFGKARDALAAFKEVGSVANGTGFGSDSFRLLTDLVGPHYTLVLETTYASLSAYEQAGAKIMDSPDWRNTYQKFVPHVESGRREIFTIVQ